MGVIFGFNGGIRGILGFYGCYSRILWGYSRILGAEFGFNGEILCAFDGVDDGTDDLKLGLGLGLGVRG